MQETEDFQPERHRFFVTWLPLQGAFARELEYKGPPGSLPFFITPALDPSPPGGSGAYNLWQLQQGLVFCWNKEPHGAVNIPKASRRRILRRLGEVDGHGLALAVVEVNVHVFDRIGFDEGLDCAVNGLDICKGAPDYARLFLDTVVSYAPLLDGAAAARALRELPAAAAALTRENSGQDGYELALAAQAAALAVLDDKKALSAFYVENLENYKFADADLGDFAADVSVQPGAPLKETFARLAGLMHPAAQPAEQSK
ncbi:MAG: hypothetical protein A2X32_03730 [Elusimicrobia bacterium GWC2_64_44]|nr:MAG: hypothetical protein A2X32_03730 [Elusimicrobia bacterium GWC2_64_44]